MLHVSVTVLFDLAGVTINNELGVCVFAASRWVVGSRWYGYMMVLD